MPGTKKPDLDKNLKKILRSSNKLKSHETKMWLRKKVSFQATPVVQNDDRSHSRSPTIKKEISKQYLFSDQEIKQNEIIEAIFKKFDSDGSGALDNDELIDLFA